MANLYCWSGAAGSGSGADWANAKTTLTAAFVTEVAGDTIFVAHDHAESTAAAITLTSSGTVALPTKIICVNRAGSVPPVSADRRATATVTTTGAAGNNITITGFAHYDGIIFNVSTGANNAGIILTTVANQWLRFDNCSLQLSNTSTATIWVGGSAGTLGGTYVEFNNTTVSFGAVGQTIEVVNTLKWRNTPNALLGTMPTTVFLPFPTRGASVECIGVDFSAAGSGKTLVIATGNLQGCAFKFVDCKLNASVTKSSFPVGHGGIDIDFIRSGSTGVNYTVYRHRISGELMEETTIIRTGGAAG